MSSSTSWFRGLWATSKYPDLRIKETRISVLSFEAASLMNELCHMWDSLSDQRVAKTREEIANSTGVNNLVSSDGDYIGRLIRLEMVQDLTRVAASVAGLSKRCIDPELRRLDRAFYYLVASGNDVLGWQLSSKEMDKNARKMERFVAMNEALYQEVETLADLEQALERMRANDNADDVALVEHKKKVVRQRVQVRYLKQNSLWIRTYDYVIRLLARSLFTIYGRIGRVFGVNQVDGSGFEDIYNSKHFGPTTVAESSVYPSESDLPSSKPVSASGPLLRTGIVEISRPGPLGISRTASCSYSRVSSFSDPLGESPTKSGPGPVSKPTYQLWQFLNISPDVLEKGPHKKPTKPGPINVSSNKNEKLSIDAPPGTLGSAALSLHYAKLIIFIEKLAPSPRSIGNDERDELYNMLPAGIRAALRATLKPYDKSLSSSVSDAALAHEWNDAITATLGWLAPLARDTITWQSERSYERQNSISKTNVLLVQTLCFANQEKAEAVITELLVGLNYVWLFERNRRLMSFSD